MAANRVWLSTTIEHILNLNDESVQWQPYRTVQSIDCKRSARIQA